MPAYYHEKNKKTYLEWSQTDCEVELKVHVARFPYMFDKIRGVDGAGAAKLGKCRLHATFLPGDNGAGNKDFALYTQPDQQVFVKGTFLHEVDSEEMMYSVCDGVFSLSVPKLGGKRKWQAFLSDYVERPGCKVGDLM